MNKNYHDSEQEEDFRLGSMLAEGTYSLSTKQMYDALNSGAEEKKESEANDRTGLEDFYTDPQPKKPRLWTPRPEGDGIDDFIKDLRNEVETGMKIEAGYSFVNGGIKAFMAGGAQKVEWVIPGLIPRGEVITLAAAGGVGKTNLMMQMLYSIATGSEFLGLPVSEGTVVGLFHEDSSRHLRERLNSLFSSFNTDIDKLDASGRFKFEAMDSDPEAEFRRKLWDGNKTKNFEDLERRLQSIGNVKVLVIDTIKEAMTGSVENGENVRHFYSALRGLANRQNIALIGTTHLNAQNKTGGSSEFGNASRCVIHITSHPGRSTLEVVKSNRGPMILPLPIKRNDSSFWEPRLTSAASGVGSEMRLEKPDRVQLLTKLFIEEVDNRPGGLSRHKHARNWAPKVIAGLARAKKIKAPTAELERTMMAMLNEGLLVEERKPGKHPTMILAVSEISGSS